MSADKKLTAIQKRAEREGAGAFHTGSPEA
jgi:hypothetical protein